MNPSICSLVFRAPVLVVVMVFFLASGLGAQTGELVKDKEHGISFKVPKEWVSIPVDPTDTLTIHKYQAKRPDEAKKYFGLQHTASLNVLYFPASKSDPDADSEEGPKKSSSRFYSIKYKSYDDYIEKNLKPKMNKKPSDKKVKKVPVTYYDMMGDVKLTSGNKIPIRFYTGLFHTEQGDFAFQFEVMDEHYKKRHYKNIKSSLNSFKLIEMESTADRDHALSQLSDNERYIQEQIDKLSSGWYYLWSSKKNYLIFSNAEKSFAKEIAKNLEGIREVYEENFPGEPRLKWIPIVRVCKTKNEYHGYGGPSGSAGYWSDMTKEFVFYNDVARGKKNTILVLKHEAFHHFIHFYLGCRLSTWMDEGFAEYFAGGEFVGKRIKIKPNQWRRGTIQREIVNNKHVPLKKLVHMTKAEYYSEPDRYAQGWSFCYFLKEGRKNGGRVKKDWESIPDRYMEHLQDAFVELEKKHPEKASKEEEVNYSLSDEVIKIALERTFDGWTDEEWEDMEKAWIDFIK